MLRVGLVLAALALCAPVADGSRAAPTPRPTTAIFYYPWFGTPGTDGEYYHWEQNGHRPSADLASAFYPTRGAYSSGDPSILDAQMLEIARAGIGEIVASWWGRGSVVDERLPAVIASARAHSLEVAAHLEPYAGRTVAGTGSRHRLPADARDPRVLRLQRNGLSGGGLAAAHRVTQRRARVRTDLAGGLREEGRLPGPLHVRHAHLPRRHVRADVQGGAQAGSVVRAVDRAGLQRATCHRRLPRARAERRQDVRHDVEGGRARRCGRRHDHQLQRVERGDADRARVSARGLRELRRRVGRAGDPQPSARTSTAPVSGPHASSAITSDEHP